MKATVSLHLRTEPHKDSTIDGNMVIGEVKRGDEILHTVKVVTSDSIESVCCVKDDVAIEIELWAVHNTDYVPTE